MMVASASCFAVADDVLVLDENGRGGTGRFRVLDHEGEALGLMVSAEEKFVAAASTARIAVDSSRIRVTVDCPVPAGMALPAKYRRSRGGEEHIRPGSREPFLRWRNGEMLGFIDSHSAD